MASYVIKSYADALVPKPKIGYLVDKVLQSGSVSIWYGYPGSLKSLLVMDMAMAVALGVPWLPGMPPNQTIVGHKTVQAPIIWIDIDNGQDVVEERMTAIGSVYGADASTPFYYMPYPTIRAVNERAMDDLTAFIAQTPCPKPFIIIDTLLRAARVKDENSSEMDTVMYNLRKMSEVLGATMALISHSNKVNNGRAGNALRGHSSIEGGVDYVFRVKRDGHSDTIEIENEKARRKPIDTFAARWTFTTDPVSDELETARFYNTTSVKVSKQQQIIDNLITQIRQAIIDNGKMNKTQLFKEIGGRRDTFNTAIDEALKTGKIVEIPSLYGNVKVYGV
ncbi:MAG: AAA family ATPase [Anaerolineaceae bacterium]